MALPRQIACRRLLSTAAPTSERLPWFVNPRAERRQLPPHQAPRDAIPLPDGTPDTIRHLHSRLVESPHLEPHSILVSQDVQPLPGPPLPIISPRGTRRRRGGTFSGSEGFSIPANVWSWIVLTQVKEGTENRGAVESVVRLIRTTLLRMQPPVFLPANSKRKMQNGWAMVDAGDFAVHVLSRDMKLKFFGDREF